MRGGSFFSKKATFKTKFKASLVRAHKTNPVVSDGADIDKQAFSKSNASPKKVIFLH